MDWMNVIMGSLSLAGAMLLLLLSLAVFVWAGGRLEGHDVLGEILLKDNHALGVRCAFFIFAVVFALLGIFDRAQGDAGIVIFIQHALIAAALIFLSRYLNDWFILYGFSNNREVVDEKNVAVAIVEGATYLASAFIIAGAFYTWEGEFWASIAWFLIGQLVLIILALLYRAMVKGVFAALDQRNSACALSLGGFLLSGGIVCGAVISGPSGGWRQDLLVVTAFMLGWMVLMVAAHVVSDLVVFRSSRIREEVMQERNIAVALLKAVVFISVTFGYTHG